MNARRLAARDNWPPIKVNFYSLIPIYVNIIHVRMNEVIFILILISWVDWPQNVGQLAAGLILLMTSERQV